MLVILSRLQFAITIFYHFIFVPLSIGLILMVTIFEFLHWKKKEDRFRKLADYFANMFVIIYAIGIVTGITMSVQFGTNWGDYTAFMGDVFGPPLALEALIAFFLESTFAGIYFFRRSKMSPKFRTITSGLILFGTMISALWIITANGFMQNPVGYELATDGSHVILTNVMELLLNPYAWYILIHTTAAALLLGGIFAISVSVAKILNPKVDEEEKEHFKFVVKIAARVSLIMAIIVPIIGMNYGAFVATIQPDKIAKIAGDSLLVSSSFSIMVLAGTILIFLSLYIVLFPKRLYASKVFMKSMKYAFVIPYIAIFTGWIVTEVGRQPWVVYGLMKTSEGVSNVPTSQVWFSLITSTLMYFAILFMIIYFIRHQSRKSLGVTKYLYKVKGGVDVK